ncbi:hypothetical protein WMF31_30740 [Sorangium sp. So ce1036]|uniref:hypothetical protein n=1 Tax=Sorangium sp. So ce1036 TaxID=3133328 RepID=UPI003F0ED579
MPFDVALARLTLLAVRATRAPRSKRGRDAGRVYIELSDATPAEATRVMALLTMLVA